MEKCKNEIFEENISKKAYWMVFVVIYMEILLMHHIIVK